MKRLLCTTGFVLAALSPAAAQAQNDVSALIDETLRGNPSIAAQRSVVEGLDARVDQVRAPALPRVDVSGLIERRWTTFENNTPADQRFTSRQGSIDGSWRVFDGFSTRYSIAAAKAERTSGERTLDSTVSDTLFQLLAGVAAVKRDRAIAGRIESRRAALAERLKFAEWLLEVREGTVTDVAQAQSRLNLVGADLETQQGEVRSTESGLVAIAGRVPGDLTLPPLPKAPASFEEARAAALATNPRVLAARADVRAAEKAAGVARAQTWPVVEAVAGSGVLAGGVPNIFIGRIPAARASSYVGAQLRVPLFQGFGEYASIRRAKALVAQRVNTQMAVEREVIQDLETAWARRQAGAAAVTEADAAVKSAREASAYMTRELQARNRTVVDALDAENDVLTAEVRAERVRYDALVAELALLRATGSLTPNALGATP